MITPNRVEAVIPPILPDLEIRSSSRQGTSGIYIVLQCCIYHHTGRGFRCNYEGGIFEVTFGGDRRGEDGDERQK